MRWFLDTEFVEVMDTKLRALRGWLAPADPHAQTVASDAISLLQDGDGRCLCPKRKEGE